SPCSGRKQPEAPRQQRLRCAVFRQYRKGLGVTKTAQSVLLEDVQLVLLDEVLQLCSRHHRQTPARPTPGACQGMQGCGEVEATQHKAKRHPRQLAQHSYTDIVTIAMMQQTDAECTIKHAIGEGQMADISG